MDTNWDDDHDLVSRRQSSTLKPIRTDLKEEDAAAAARMGAANIEELAPLSPMARLFHEPDCNLYIITIIGWKTQINIHAFKANLLCNLLHHPRFSSLQVLDEKKGKEMKWLPTKVDIENHVIVPQLKPNMESPDQFVEEYISNLSATTVDMSKPLWDLHILNVKTSNAEAVSVFRFHHSLGDGTSLISLLLACTRKTSDPQALPSIPLTTSRPSSSSTMSFQYLWSFLWLAWNTITGIFMFLLTLLFLTDTKTPLSLTKASSTTRRRIIHRTFSLDDVKLVKKATNTTINNVMLGVTQAGLSRYLNRKYGNKAYFHCMVHSCNLPEKIRLRATHFINVRPKTGIHELAEMMKKGSKARWGNSIGYVLLPLTIALRDDPLDYVRGAKVAMDRKKASFEATCVSHMAKLIPKLFGFKAASILSYRVPSRTTLWFSNVVGPQEEIGFIGCPIAYIAPSCFGQPSALMIHVVSYMDKITVVMSADEDTIPNPQELCDDLEESFNLIRATACHM
ncbi:wax ester synthase/diacylglycerol acyltransferase 11-like [Malania oleifera]|uniref:wax ester synthase/diacylglycerol acyltransferase 11-like n=1 Tax=Malania oleifera TaxID=397392 RepID=UPI0025ADAC32|nr:wax ester synthase/diacylglycerol acyltransferase 11-like [Malania oleifera]